MEDPEDTIGDRYVHFHRLSERLVNGDTVDAMQPESDKFSRSMRVAFIKAMQEELEPFDKA